MLLTLALVYYWAAATFKVRTLRFRMVRCSCFCSRLLPRNLSSIAYTLSVTYQIRELKERSVVDRVRHGRMRTCQFEGSKIANYFSGSIPRVTGPKKSEYRSESIERLGY